MDASTTVRATKRWWFELLACLALLAAAIAVVGVSAAPPSAADLAHCPKSCGGVNISYPYGIGPGCFRPGFEVTCNHSTRPPKLFLANTTTTEIVKQYPWGAVDASIVFNIATRPGAFGNYSWSWEAPGKSLALALYGQSTVFIVGCGFEAFLFENTTSGPGDLLGNCASTCDDSAALGTEAEEGGCNGMGCCNIVLQEPVRAFALSIIQKEETVPAALANATVKAFLSDGSYNFSMADLLSDKVNGSTIGAATADLVPVIIDQPTCRTARMNKQYACAANSDCKDSYDGSGGYRCRCSSECDDGNPYVVGPGGCSSGKYCTSNGDDVLRDQFTNLHVHIYVFLFIFNLIPYQQLKYIFDLLQLLSTAAYKQAIIIFLKHRTNARTLISYTCTLTHVSPRTNTPLVNH